MVKEIIDGKHYSEYSDYINELVRKENYNEAIDLLVKIIEIMENVAIEKGVGVAPWYYDKLSLIYKKMKNKEAEIQTLKRFLSQPKARGSRPKKIYDKYIKLNKDTNEDQLQNYIYKEYKKVISSSSLTSVNRKCSNCRKKGDYLVPIDERGKEIKFFGACCPFCCTSDLITL